MSTASVASEREREAGLQWDAYNMKNRGAEGDAKPNTVLVVLQYAVLDRTNRSFIHDTIPIRVFITVDLEYYCTQLCYIGKEDTRSDF
jgi:hypothetical protein